MALAQFGKRRIATDLEALVEDDARIDQPLDAAHHDRLLQLETGDAIGEQATNAVPQIEGKKVKVFGISSTERLALPVLAQTPTLAESGLTGFNVTVWHGLYAPRDTPPEVLARLNTALRAALKDPELIRRQEALGLRVVADARLDPAGHKKFVEGEIGRWAKVIKDSGETAE